MSEKISTHPRRFFFTGFPGFIGARLVTKLLQQYPKSELVFLVQPQFVAQASQLLCQAEFAKCHVEIVTGDISQKNLGLTPEKYQSITAQLTDIFHLAAIYDLAVPAEVARKVNVTGTHHMVELAAATSRLHRFVYFSTCYVAGCSTGVFYEDTLPKVENFKNHYESTKYEAESLVREKWDTIPTTIVRPAIVVGDAQTGETQKFDGPYFSMILIDRLKKLGLPLPYIGSSTARVNVVPVDFVVDATLALWGKDCAAGKCFALADPNPPTVQEVYAATLKHLKAQGPWGKVSPALLEFALHYAPIRKFLKLPREIITYFNYDLTIDTKNTQETLADTGIDCPPFLSYLPRLVEFFDANKHRKELYWKAY